MNDSLGKTIEFYVKRIMSGKTTIDKVPEVIREKVRDILKDDPYFYSMA